MLLILSKSKSSYLWLYRERTARPLLLMLTRCYDEGFSEGTAQGILTGTKEGLETGFEAGHTFGLFFGEIYGYCLYLKAKMVKEALNAAPSSSSTHHTISARQVFFLFASAHQHDGSYCSDNRALITLDHLLKMCQELPLENTEVASQQFDKIVSKYKLLLAQTQSPDVMLSSTTKSSSISY